MTATFMPIGPAGRRTFLPAVSIISVLSGADCAPVQKGKPVWPVPRLPSDAVPGQLSFPEE